jgi:hypothetical protein
MVCEEEGCNCERLPWECCNCPPLQYPADDDIPPYELAHCVLAARYNDGQGDSALCHECQHFLVSHAVEDTIRRRWADRHYEVISNPWRYSDEVKQAVADQETLIDIIEDLVRVVMRYELRITEMGGHHTLLDIGEAALNRVTKEAG